MKLVLRVERENLEKAVRFQESPDQMSLFGGSPSSSERKRPKPKGGTPESRGLHQKTITATSEKGKPFQKKVWVRDEESEKERRHQEEIDAAVNYSRTAEGRKDERLQRMRKLAEDVTNKMGDASREQRMKRDSEADEEKELLNEGLRRVPGIRLGDAREAGVMARLLDKKEISQTEFDAWVAQAKRENRIRQDDAIKTGSALSKDKTIDVSEFRKLPRKERANIIQAFVDAGKYSGASPDYWKFKVLDDEFDSNVQYMVEKDIVDFHNSTIGSDSSSHTKLTEIFKQLPANIQKHLGEMYVVASFDERPKDIPDDWLIFNASRWLNGDKQWEGPFFRGKFYAAVDPKGEFAEQRIRENAGQQGWVVDYKTKDQAYAHVRDLVIDEERKGYNPKRGPWDGILEMIDNADALDWEQTFASYQTTPALFQKVKDYIKPLKGDAPPKGAFHPFQEAPTEKVREKDSFDPQAFLNTVADSWEKLRKPDVYRLIDESGDKHAEAMASTIKKKRPDLKDEVDAVMKEIDQMVESGTFPKATKAEKLPPKETKPKPKKETPVQSGLSDKELDRYEQTGKLTAGMYAHLPEETRKQIGQNFLFRPENRNLPYDIASAISRGEIPEKYRSKLLRHANDRSFYQSGFALR